MYLIGSAVAGLISLACLVAAVSAFVKQRRQRAGSVATSGVVTGLALRVMSPGRPGVYCPSVAFTALSGEQVAFESAFGSMPAGYKVGQMVKVFYNPAQPREAEIDSGLSRWLAPGCYLAFALGAGFFSLVFLGLSFVVPMN